ncbi:prion-like-(Q/N-rich) domain-bearing protein 25 [Hylaeus volcanicus]|uniref:prion-like-(Q/N-rich) domain-bearing protein 25 n=1 Tax=Hylaeus volcanicus TaxID=313075 RepID=UPI0023B7F022|nr:prion-like-(Q/N-rich) domain-bearing protein 25 [Hylaeus volcanicus]
MSITSQVCLLQLESFVANMSRTQNIILCFLFITQCSFTKGSAFNTKLSEGNVAIQEEFTDIWKCETNFDCTVSNSSCVKNVCQCQGGYDFNGSMTSCIKVATTYGDDCTESVQCSRHLYSGGICENNVCVCAKGYYYLHGRCNLYKGLHATCLKDSDCYVNSVYGASICQNGICACRLGFYQREYRTCRPEGNKVGDKCVINNDCTFNSTAHCDDFKCTLPSAGNTTSQFLEDKNVVHENSTDKSVFTIDKVCKVDTDCEDLKNAICGPLKTCVCKRAYFFNKNNSTEECVPELGEPCDVNDKPEIEFSVCENGIWNCEPQRVASYDNKECLKATMQYMFSCRFDKQCYIFGPDAICSEDKCVCNENSHFIESQMFCWVKKKLGETCKNAMDCYVNETSAKPTCTQNVCTCPQGTKPNSERTACEKIVIGAIDSNCTTNKDCPLENTECNSNRCTCQKNYVAVSIDTCLPLASFGEPCEKDIQCSVTVSNAICSDDDLNKTCTCAEGYHRKFDNCYQRKVLGEKCTNLGVCYLDSNIDRVVCKNGLCACDWGYIRINATVCEISPNKQAYFNGIDSGASTIRNISGGLLPILLLLMNLHKLI